MLLQQTRTIPIIFASIADPVGSGFVASFARPGGNATGFTILEPTMAGKWLELLKEIVPRVTRVATLFNPATAPYFDYFVTPFKAAAPSFGVEAIVAPVRDKSELESAIAAQGRAPNTGLVVMPDSFMTAHRARRLRRWRRASACLSSLRIATTPNLAACCRTELTSPTITDVPLATPIASSRAQSRASLRSRPRSSSSW